MNSNHLGVFILFTCIGNTTFHALNLFTIVWTLLRFIKTNIKNIEQHNDDRKYDSKHNYKFIRCKKLSHIITCYDYTQSCNLWQHLTFSWLIEHTKISCFALVLSCLLTLTFECHQNKIYMYIIIGTFVPEKEDKLWYFQVYCFCLCICL